MDENSKRTIVIVWLAVGVMTVGCGLLIAALIIRPPGIIDNSVLVAFGEVSTFVAALMGVHLRIKK